MLCHVCTHSTYIAYLMCPALSWKSQYLVLISLFFKVFFSPHSLHYNLYCLLVLVLYMCVDVHMSSVAHVCTYTRILEFKVRWFYSLCVIYLVVCLFFSETRYLFGTGGSPVRIRQVTCEPHKSSQLLNSIITSTPVSSYSIWILGLELLSLYVHVY